MRKLGVSLARAFLAEGRARATWGVEHTVRCTGPGSQGLFGFHLPPLLSLDSSGNLLSLSLLICKVGIFHYLPHRVGEGIKLLCRYCAGRSLVSVSFPVGVFLVVAYLDVGGRGCEGRGKTGLETRGAQVPEQEAWT